MMPVAHSPRPEARPRRPRASGTWSRLLPVLLVSAPLIASCEETVIETVGIDRVVVTPGEARLTVGASLQLSAELLDDAGEPVSGVPIAWSTDDDDVAEVSGSGRVTARGSGEVTVRATAGGASGTATLEVSSRGHIVLSPASVSLTATAGSTDPSPIDVAVRNSGEEPLESLQASVEFAESGPDGWLAATLASTEADTEVRLTVALGSLSAGTYSADVRIADPAADNSPATIEVTLDVLESAPDEPSDLTAATGAEGIELAWTDNSDNETEFRIERLAPDESDFAVIATVGEDVTSYVDGSAEPDRTYGYRVRACGGGGCSGPSGEATVLTRPYAPSSVSAAALSSRAVRVRWTDESETETGFRVERRNDDGSFAEVGSVQAGSTDYTDNGLKPETTYVYRVRACNAGGCSPASNEAEAQTLDLPVPSSPSGLTVVDETANGISLAWSDNSSVETGFLVQRRGPDDSAFEDLTVVSANTTAYTDESVALDGHYAYRVAACAEGGCSTFTGEVTGTTPPAAPGGVKAETVSPGAIRVSWSDPNTTTTELRLDRSEAGGAYAQVRAFQPGTTSFQDEGLSPDTRYGYRIRACNEAPDCSAPSGEATARTDPLPIPDAPSSAQIEVEGDSVLVRWKDNSDDETGFEVWRRDPGTQEFTRIATTGADQEAHLDDTASEDATYAYRVRACAGGGCSGWTNEVSATTRPRTPVNLDAVAQSSNAIRVTWTDNSDTEIDFELERRTGTGSYQRIARLGAGTTDFDDTGLQASTTYVYRIRACNDAGCSLYADPAAAGTNATPPPAAPSNLTAEAVSEIQVDLEWVDNSDTETSFEVWRKTGNDSFTLLTTLDENTDTYSDESVLPETTYTYQVRACGSAGCSAYTDPVTVTTLSLAAASELQATEVSDKKVRLTWADNSTGEAEYRVLRRKQRRTSWSDYSDVSGVLPPDTESFEDDDVKKETRYQYMVRVCDAVGGCVDSDNLVVRTPDD